MFSLPQSRYFIHKVIFICLFFAFSAFANAETIHLNDGRVVEGAIIEKTTKYIKVDLVDGLGRMTYYFDEIKDIDGQPFVPQEVTNQNENLADQKPESVSPAQISNQPVNTNEEDIRKAYDFIQKSNCDSAIPILNKVIENDPNNSLAYQYRGWCLGSKQNIDGALNDYLNAVKLNPEEAKWFNKSIADIYFAKGNNAQADAYYCTYLKYFPNDGDAYYVRAVIRFGEGLYDASLNDLNKAESFGVKDSQGLQERLSQVKNEKDQQLQESQPDSSNPAAQPSASNSLSFDGRNWKLGTSYKKGRSIYLEFGIDGKITNWTELITYTKEPALPSGATVQFFVDDYIKSIAQVCPGVSSNIISKGDSEIIFEWSIANCSVPDQGEIDRVVASPDAIYFLQYTAKPSVQSKQQWVQILGAFNFEGNSALEALVQQAESNSQSTTKDYDSGVVKATLHAMCMAAESYAQAQGGIYPDSMAPLTDAQPPYYLDKYNFCGKTDSGFEYTCSMAKTGYTFKAVDASGTTTYAVTTGCKTQ